MTRDDQTNLPSEEDRQSSVEEIADLFNDIAETIAEIVTPDDTESALQNLFDRIKSEQNGADPGEPVQEHWPPIPPAKITQDASGEAARAFLRSFETFPPLRDFLNGQAWAAVEHDDVSTGGALPHWGGAPQVEEMADLVASLNQQRRGTPSQTDASSAGHAPPDSALMAGNIAPRRAGVPLVRSRDIGRVADDAVGALGSLAAPGRDLRTLSWDDREETQVLLAQARELLSGCPGGALGRQGSVMVLEAVATLAERLIEDRDERTAWCLIRAASPHLEFVGRRDPAAFGVRRAEAAAVSELGRRARAETRLRELSQDEERVFGAADPRTQLLLPWALVGQDRLREADAGFRSLVDRLIRSPDAETLLHVLCRWSWLAGRLGRVDQSVRGYTGVIAARTARLGKDHPDTLDAVHSLRSIELRNGQGSQTLSLLQALAEDRARVQGERHPDTLKTLEYLGRAKILDAPGDDRIRSHVIREHIEIWNIQRKRLGQGHPMVQDTTATLRKLLREKPIYDPQPVPTTDEHHTMPLSRSSDTARNTHIISLQQVR